MQINDAQDIAPITRRQPPAKVLRFMALFVLFVIFTTAAVSKALSFSQFKSTLIVSRLIPLDLVVPFGIAIIVIELSVSLGLCVPAWRKPALQMALVLVCTFFSYSVWRWMQNIPIPCTCFGPLLKMPPYQSLLLNLFLLSLVTSLLRHETTIAPPQSLVAQGSNA
jgi:uncharacterized membrane protein